MDDDSNAVGGEEDKDTAELYDDDTVVDDTVTDPITIEAQGDADDPVKILGVPEDILKEEMDKRAFDGAGEPNGSGEPRTSSASTMYEGTEDVGGDIYNSQEDAFDQRSDAIENES